MSNINNQTQDLYSIESVQDLDHEAAATVSGGLLVLSDLYNGRGTKRYYTGSNRSLGVLNNDASWYEVTGNKDWYVWTNKNFTGKRYRLKAGSKGNLYGYANNNWESATVIS